MALIEFENNQAPYLNAENLNNNFSYTIPIGAISLFAGTTVPNGWLTCDGSEISRDEYSELFSIIGTYYGIGDGETTFNLPNLKGRVPVGLNEEDNDFENLGKSGGEKSHTLTINEMPKHSHQQYVTANVGTAAVRTDFNSDGDSERYPQCQTGLAGGSQPHNIMQPYLVMNYIIKS